MMWVYDPGLAEAPYPCEEATETAVPRGNTPHFLPGQSPLPGLNPKLGGSLRHADRSAAGRAGNDVS